MTHTFTRLHAHILRTGQNPGFAKLQIGGRASRPLTMPWRAGRPPPYPFLKTRVLTRAEYIVIRTNDRDLLLGPDLGTNAGLLSPLRGLVSFIHRSPTAHAVGYYLCPRRGLEYFRTCPLNGCHTCW